MSGALAAAIDSELQAGGTPASRAGAGVPEERLRALRHLGSHDPSSREGDRTPAPRMTHGNSSSSSTCCGRCRCTSARGVRRAARSSISTGSARPTAPLLERFLRESQTWALVDVLAASVVGPLVERHPETRRPCSTGGQPTTTSGCGGRRCSRLLSHSDRAAATSTASAGTPTRCSTSVSSSSARPSAGCFRDTGRANAPTSCTNGCCRGRHERRA